MPLPHLTLSFELWLEIHEQDLFIKAAELGLDRDADFDCEAFAEREYEKYLTEVCQL